VIVQNVCDVDLAEAGLNAVNQSLPFRVVLGEAGLLDSLCLYNNGSSPTHFPVALGGSIDVHCLFPGLSLSIFGCS
jgi:hypothetical protein